MRRYSIRQCNRTDVNAFIRNILDHDPNDVQSVEISPNNICVRVYVRDGPVLRLDHLGPVVWDHNVEIISTPGDDDDT